MIVTFFKGDHSSVTNGLEYLEGGTKTRKVAPELLSGNPDVTRELLKEASRFSKAYTYGCLGFEESNIPTSQKQKLMESFEQTLMAGLNPNQYDMVWIEHRDKDRLELNFHVVNMELTTGKALTPYVHSRDVKRIDTWKSIANDTYGFTDPNDPSKKRTFALGNNSRPRQEVMRQVDQHIFQRAADGELNNQKDIVNALNAIDGVTVTRNTKSSISFKAEGHEKPIRLKGDMYGKSFEGIEDLAAEQARRLQAFNAERDQRLTRNRKELGERNRHIANQRRQQYPKPTPPKPSNTNAVGAVPVPSRDDSRALPSNGIRDPKVSPLHTGGQEPRRPEPVVLPNEVTPNKNNDTHVKHDNKQPQSPTSRASKFIQGIKQAIRNFAERVTARKTEAGELRENYGELEQNCYELDRLLKGAEGLRLKLEMELKAKDQHQSQS
ncbi:hypothetical protein, partial [Vibrio sp. 10N.261.51.E5]|uniref:hypothetical protein n=1 Tax=Vibrio sp. 10N.261.51.E5 TaxID=3229677 RepID=UPI00354B05CE